MSLAESDNTKKLADLINSQKTEFDVLAEALKEVAKEDGEKRKQDAKGLIRQALELKSKMDQAERTFNSEKKKFDKALGKVMNRLKNMANGKPINEGEDEDENPSQ